ncbi:MAG: TonB-dependent receptor [Chitinophagales bacterium]|nr:MAG: TonB-dependent receptor [Chitinophagales bacterium]
MGKFKIPFLLFLMLFAVGPLSAQDTLKGIVAEENHKGHLNPLVGVNVYWPGTSIGTVTDSNGIFTVECLHETHPLVVSYVGYVSDTLSIANHDFLTIILKNTRELQEVEISYRKKSAEISFLDPAKTLQISQKELFKAACCNLSESFETTPSVDVSFTDAITGTRQIQMLGLASAYTSVTKENLPYLRGLGAGQGFSWLPGTWIQSIQLSKGCGSVVNGYEGIAGQINVEPLKAEESPPNTLNVFLNQEGRTEMNMNLFNSVNPNWSATTLLHGSGKPFKIDNNKDGFMDFPRKYLVTGMSRWKYDSHTGLESEIGLTALRQDEVGGQMRFRITEPRDTLHPYGYGMKTNRVEAFLKLGYVFPEKRYKSFGLQLSGVWHDLNGFFGLRNYSATQYSSYSNFIYQSILGNSNNKFKTGISMQADFFDESLDSLRFDRTEYVPGAFFEYTFTHLDKITLVAGGRVDYNPNYGLYAVPRLHARFALTPTTVLRLSGGAGHRTPSIIAENIGLLATSRTLIIIPNDDVHTGFRLKPELAWNYGISFTQEFSLKERDGTFSIDFYRTDFQNQVVIDLDHNPREVRFYNLNGKSRSNSIQAQLDMEIIERFDIRLSYRWYDVKTTYTRGFLEKPLVAAHRAFINLAYETAKKDRAWKFDITAQWLSRKRIPYTASNPMPYRLHAYSPHFFLMNAQISKAFKRGVEIYAGMENILNFMQHDPILASDQPYSGYFDSSLIWGPVFGRTAYAGFRYNFYWKKDSPPAQSGPK